MHILPPADFCVFGLEHVVPITTDFLTVPIKCNIVARRWWTGHSSSHLPVLENTNMDHCELMHLNNFHKTRRSYWMWSLADVKTIPHKTRRPFSCRTLSDGIVTIHGANVSVRLRCFRPSIELEQKNMSEMFQFLHLALHFLASMVPLAIFKWQNFNM